MSDVEQKAYEILGEKRCGNIAMPLDSHSLNWNSKEGCDRVAMFVDDAAGIGIGHPDQWHIVLPREEFNKVIRWYLRKWAFGEWFGIRRKACYFLLQRRAKSENSKVVETCTPIGNPEWLNELAESSNKAAIQKHGK